MKPPARAGSSAVSVALLLIVLAFVRPVEGVAAVTFEPAQATQAETPTGKEPAPTSTTTTLPSTTTTLPSTTTKVATVVSLVSDTEHNGTVVAAVPLMLHGQVNAEAEGDSEAVPTGTVSLVVNGVDMTEGPVAVVEADGSYVLPELVLSATAEPVGLAVRYTGDAIFGASMSATKTVKVYDSTTVTAIGRRQRATLPYGAKLVFRAHVSSVPEYGVDPTGWVQFTVDGIPASELLPINAHGDAKWRASLGIGTASVVATYVADQAANTQGLTSSQAELRQVVTVPRSPVATRVTAAAVPLERKTVAFKVSGEVVPPPGLPGTKACVGTISVRLRSGAHESTSTGRLNGDCRYSLKVSLAPGEQIGKAGTARVSAEFSGNKYLSPSETRMVFKRSSSAGGPTASSEPGWIVGLGDSSMSGEGGRWAGNTNQGFGIVDALGSNAYGDEDTNFLSLTPGDPLSPGVPVSARLEIIPGCHRSRSEEVFIGGGVKGINLACSGARNYTHTTAGHFKPGLDLVSSQTGSWTAPSQLNLSQPYDLASVASQRSVTMIMLAIGINDFNFSDVIEACLGDYLTSRSSHGSKWVLTWNPLSFHKVTYDHRNFCSDDPNVTDNFSATNSAAIRAKIRQSIVNVAQMMANLDLTRNDYKIVVQNYPGAFATASQMRNVEGNPNTVSSALLLDKDRQWVGGCGFWDTDVDWMMGTALPVLNSTVADAAADAGASTVTTVNYGNGTTTYSPNVEMMDVSNALRGHELCSNATSLLGAGGSWMNLGAADSAEWVNQIHVLSSLFPYYSEYSLQESAHPNYWGQLAFRSCVRMVYNKTAPPPAGGWPCLPQPGGGINGQVPHEPNMKPF